MKEYVIEVKNIDKEIKNTKKYLNYCDKNNLKIKYNTDDKTLKEIENAINIKDKYKRYEYIYDTVCFYLDERRKTNYCMFKDDMCVRDRLKNNNHKNGCCESKGKGKCEYLKDRKCILDNCISCKLFTCHALKKLGITQEINDFPLTKYFFTRKQKDILRFSYWTPREIVLDRLMTNTYVRP